MLILLPPSETKRDGGDPARVLALSDLGFPALNPIRRRMLAAVRALSRNRATMAAALGLGPQQQGEIDRNRSLRASPVMPAIDRYSGVLYDALDATTLPDSAREFAFRHVAVHSALFGLLRAADPIPAYRLSHDSRLPDLPLGRTWRAAITAELTKRPGLILDLRSEAYAALGPAPESAAFVRVVTVGADGTRRALGHFNKQGKGALVRAILEAGTDHGDLDSLLDWADGAGIRMSRGDRGEVVLAV